MPDYLQVISEPMDLETMMTKIDLHKYECAQDFLRDIELIVSNALEYNPDKNPEGEFIEKLKRAYIDGLFLIHH